MRALYRCGERRAWPWAAISTFLEVHRMAKARDAFGAGYIATIRSNTHMSCLSCIQTNTYFSY